MKQSAVCYYCFKNPIYHDDRMSLCVDHQSKYHPELNKILAELETTNPNLDEIKLNMPRSSVILNNFLVDVPNNTITPIISKNDDLLEFKKSELKSTCLHNSSAGLLKCTPFTTTSNNLIKCNDCDLISNLWCCLECGYVGCGRKQLGINGNSHMLNHNSSTRHPVVVKLTSLSLDDYDVYCYDCDDSLQFNSVYNIVSSIFNANSYDLNNFLANQKSESTLYELELNQNLKISFNINGVPYKSVGHIGLVNTGNSCYINAVIQSLNPLLLSIIKPLLNTVITPSFVDNLLESDSITSRMLQQCYYQFDEYYLQNPPTNKVVYSNNQQIPINNNATSSTSQIGLNLIKFKQQFAMKYPFYNNMHQQDAQEFLLFLLDSLEVINNVSLDIIKYTKYQLSNDVSSTGCLTLRPTTTTTLNELLKDVKFIVLPHLLIIHMYCITDKGQKMDIDVKCPLHIQLVTAAANEQSVPVNSPQQKPNAEDPQSLSLLMDMGIDEDICHIGLQKYKSMETALEWCLNVNEMINNILDMGFNKNQAKWGLEMSEFNLEMALMLIMEGNVPNSNYTYTGLNQATKPARPAGSLDIEPPKSAKYLLKSIVSHKGSSTQSGHYVSHLLIDGVWILMNDDHVLVDEVDLGKGYLYFYYNEELIQ
eukprot:NODE_405_length_9256_cov_0.230316.p1 type:complete len:650 gc:universal NODE_405_length_9256_cov_0.230316:8648-6699(-)